MSSTAKNLYDQLWALPDEERLQIHRALNEGRKVLEFKNEDKKIGRGQATLEELKKRREEEKASREIPESWQPTEEDRESNAKSNAKFLALAGLGKDSAPFNFDPSYDESDNS